MKRGEFLPLLPQDIPALEVLCDRQNERDGTSYGVPGIFDAQGNLRPNIALSGKVVRNGCLTQAYVFVLVPELLCFGFEPRDTLTGLKELPSAAYLLQQHYTGFRSLVPLSLVERWERSLGTRLKMQRDDAKLANFYHSFRRDGGA